MGACPFNEDRFIGESISDEAISQEEAILLRRSRDLKTSEPNCFERVDSSPLARNLSRLSLVNGEVVELGSLREKRKTGEV